MPNRAPLPREPASISPHDRIAKLHDKQVGLYFGWSTDDTVETQTYSTYVNEARDTRDDMLERIQHSDSERLGELEKGFNKMTELLSVLVNTRTTANPNEVQQHNSQDFQGTQ